LGGEWEERLPLMARARTTSGRWRTGFVHGFVIYGWLLSFSLLSLLSSAEEDQKWNWYMPTRLSTLPNSKLVAIY
jgi:hypothetical protein